MRLNDVVTTGCRPLYVVMGIAFAVGAALNACDKVADVKNQPNTGPFDVDGFLVNPPAMALFVDGGEKIFKAVFPEEAVGRVTVEWETDNPEVAEIIANEDIVTVLPKSAGNAEITAKIKLKNAGQELNTEITQIICPVTVLTDFNLDSTRLLFFEGEPSQRVTALLPEAVLEVAEIHWSLEAQSPDTITIDGNENYADISVSGIEPLGVITARLEAKDTAAFNGTGRSTVCLVTTLEAPYLEITPASIMLREDDAPRSTLIPATYGPAYLDMWHPQLSWESHSPALLQFEGESAASLGRASARITVTAAGQAEITAELTVEERSISDTAVITINPYTEPTSPALSLTLDKKPFEVIKSDYTELITATLSGASGAAPSDPFIEWDFSENNVVDFDYLEDPTNHSKVRILGVWTSNSNKTVTVTARSRSNSNIFVTFDIMVRPLTVTVSTAASGGSTNLISGQAGTVNLQAEVNAHGNKEILQWTANPLSLVTLTPDPSDSKKIQVSIKSGVSVTGTQQVQIIAAAASDNGVTSGWMNIILNAHSFNITYHKNDGSEETAQGGPYIYGGTQTFRTISDLGWALEGHSFSGWAFSADGAVMCGNGAGIATLNDNDSAKTQGGTVNVFVKWHNITGAPTEQEMNNDDFGPGANSAVTYNVHNEEEWDAAMDSLVNGSGNFIINVLEDFQCGHSKTFTGEKIVSIRGVGRTIFAPEDAAAPFFNVTSLTRIILRDITVDGHKDPARADGANRWHTLMLLSQNAVLEMKGVSRFIQLFGDKDASAVKINGNGKFIMRDSSIITESWSGGNGSGMTPYTAAVRVNTGGIFEMYDQSTLTGNLADVYNISTFGAGVNVLGGTFTMNDESSIVGSRINISGGAYWAVAYGGGVYLSDGVFTMNDNAVISGCSAHYGGGLCLIDSDGKSSIFIKNGGTIYGSEASDSLKNTAGGGAALWCNWGASSRETTITPEQNLRYENRAWTTWLPD